jgi:hypothetical protein
VPFDLFALVNAEMPIEQVIGTSFPWCTRWAAKPKELFGGKRRPCRYDDGAGQKRRPAKAGLRKGQLVGRDQAVLV